MERRLAAVMIADVVGYGRLSQIDEEGTRARFQADLKEIFEPRITAYRGRLIKTMGDGLLVEFPSVVDALRCAVEVQQEKARRDAASPPGQRLDFRIGVNLGDIIVEGDDIHGDGVNIADRLQALAEPGGVAISGTAYDHVKTKLPVGYASLGEQTVKSIAEPVRVYRVVLDPSAAGTTVAAPNSQSAMWWWPTTAAIAAILLLLLGVGAAWWRQWQTNEMSAIAAAAPDDRPSLVVLPFDNLSGDDEQGYLADGITEDLTTELARIPGLLVISRNAAFNYKDKEIQPAEIASALGVRYLLEGSVRRVGDDMRINAQLIEATTARHMWAERFDGAWKDVFALQDKVLTDISAALKLRLLSGPSDAEGAGGTDVPAAYEAYLKGVEHMRRETPEDLAQAALLFTQATELDVDYGRAWANLAWVYWISWDVSEREAALGLPHDAMLPKVYTLLAEAEKHDSPAYYQLLADILTVERDLDAAIAAVQSAIALDPSEPYNYDQMSLALTFSGRAADAEQYVVAASRVDPNPTDWRHYLTGIAYFGQARFEDAVVALEQIDPQTSHYWAGYFSMFFLTSAYAHLGRLDDAKALNGKLEAEIQKRGDTTASILLALSYFPFKQTADRERLFEGLRKAGVPELPFGFSPRVKDKLSGEEVRSLVFGHEIEGRTESGEAYGRITATDGETQVKFGPGPWTSGVTSTIEGDALCAWDVAFGGSCGLILRNPEGSFDNRNEYLFVRAYDYREFSVVK